MRGVAEWTRACGTGEAAEGSPTAVTCAGRRMVILREGDRVYAADAACTHADADLSGGFVAPGAGPGGEPGIRCPLHLSVFELGRGVPLNPPAERPVAVYPAKIDGDSVYVEA
ncbi:MAG: Rieske 2Fe-2S domain-containing protein [Thaumarchaeota archaeon]|nr:Rieske 2Fe-2S domain-containing protein [Nitrososphaerota archaeon]MDD9825823.1 Rieske 2Fe-2S domain-containing protein [Nitrososphaerota archaeon]RNJ72312.1 MAG: non-heme iron oxygenase ferredoxin subunit [Thaumarchaeota archaeon S13]RNJ72738.1 MAG: non-heme iron oxygenase ferredoxin subunit [Thaumarchaeota archaeon S14]RNJ76298.1 MAG: non-heme iron oxygenase ferredoxin subunit [Thaumarchaeota archaeon S15]